MPAVQRLVPEAVARPVAAPPADSARSTQPHHRRTRPRGRDGPELAGLLGDALWHMQADRADRTRAGPSDVLTLGRPSERAAPRIAPGVQADAPAAKRRHGSGHGPSNGQFGGGDARTASTTSSTATGGSGSGSGAGAAGLVALVAFAVVSGAAVRLLIASPRWRSLTLLSLLERPG